LLSPSCSINLSFLPLLLFIHRRAMALHPGSCRQPLSLPLLQAHSSSLLALSLVIGSPLALSFFGSSLRFFLPFSFSFGFTSRRSQSTKESAHRSCFSELVSGIVV
jgi:hypothetical protein